ncbi:hypothetical protein PG984_000574 [Apiospora sp. TS-2023a]
MEVNPDKDPYKSISLDGSHSPFEPQTTIAGFKDNRDVHILVCTMGVAGQGLDFPMADTVFLMDTA